MNLDARTNRVARFTIIAGFLVALVLIASAIISAYILRQNSIKDRSEQISNLTVVLSEHAAQTMYSANTALDSLTDAVAAANIKTEAEYRAFAEKKAQFLNLEEKTNSNAIIDVATYVGADGRVLNFSRSYPPPKIDLSMRDYYQYLSTHTSTQTFFSNPVRNKGNGNWVFYLAKRISNAKDEFLGIALIGVSAEVFSKFYEQIGSNLGDGSSLVLFKKDQTLLTRWPFVEERIGKINNSENFTRALEDAKLQGQVIMTDAPTAIRNNERVQRMVAFRNVPGYPLVVGAIATEELYLTGWRKSLYGIVLTTALSLILVLVGVRLLLRSLRANFKNQHLANHDALTGLPNRLLFADRLQQTLAQAERNKTKFALVYLDLDNLKFINDTYSHRAGDEVLCEAANRMLNNIRSSDTVARIGGDEFVMLLPNIENEHNALAIAEKVRIALLERFSVNGQDVVTGASIGIALFPDHGDSEANLSAIADKAMYRAKSGGRNRVCLFDPLLDNKTS